MSTKRITSLRELRLSQATHTVPLTLAALAAKMDPPSTKQYLGKIETGTLSATPALLQRIARALRMPYRDVVAVYLRQVGGMKGWDHLRKRTKRYWGQYRPKARRKAR